MISKERGQKKLFIQVSWRNNKIKLSGELSQGGRCIRPPVTLKNSKFRSKRRLKIQMMIWGAPRHLSDRVEVAVEPVTGVLQMMGLIEAKWDQWVLLSTVQTDNDPKQTLSKQRSEVKSPDPNRAAVQWLNAQPSTDGGCSKGPAEHLCGWNGLGDVHWLQNELYI